MNQNFELEKMEELLKTAIPLFNGTAPGSEGVELLETVFAEDWECGRKKIIAKDTLVPVIIPFIPEKPNKTAVIVIPGGAYRRQVLNLEGTEVAEWLNAHGITAFVLRHRLPVNAHKAPGEVALVDVLRAVRLVRSRADEYGIESGKIGVMGFSAGGHLASLAATCYERKPLEFSDELETVSARPDFCVLGYPAISYEVHISNPRSERDDEKHLKEYFKYYSTENLVTKDTPPVFLFETDDDMTTYAEHSVRFYLAARQAGVPAELHIFKEGEHGFGLGETRGRVAAWKELFLSWLGTIV